ncbi:Right handed beta helix region [Curtobacterium sp. 9128]|uniref:right-handed parallel beta-helix repeat-containing protein n=1 Tax=Curtobacterium sp. 9128 TaxID=1793722 RepID=UPI0007D7241B|nr:right-handed parallel beta-helix repeat-containing protein [Curtobacterium sp. 9128]SBN61234.1 Right handed beta helix region [Curtobacterium sp. 9128]
MTTRAIHTRRTMIGLAGIGLAGAVLGEATAASAASAVGARFTATAKTTTDELNRWLAARDSTRIRRLTGVVVLTKPLVVPANTLLDAHGATITGPPTDNVLRNAASIATVVTSVAVTAGSPVVTSAAGAFTADMVGRRIQVLDAGSRAWRPGAPTSLYGRVVTVTSPGQATLDVPATSTLTAQAYVYPVADTTITIQGGTWINRNKNSLSQKISSHGFLIRRASGVTIADLTVKGQGAKQMGGQYAISLGDVSDVTVSKITFTDTSSDGLHFQGPASTLRISDITGSNSGDDLVAFTGVDGKSRDGSRLGDVEGDITDVVLRNVRGSGCHTHLKITSGVGAGEVQRHVSGFTATGISGTVSSGGAPVNVVDYAGSTSFSGSITGVTATPSGASAMVNVGASIVGDLVVGDVTWTTAKVPTNGIVRVVQSSTTPTVTAGSITVRNVVRKDTAGKITDTTGAGLALGTRTLGTLTVTGVGCPVPAPHFDSVQLASAGMRIDSMSVASDSSAARTGNVLVLPVSSKGYSIGAATFSSISRSTGSLWSADADGDGTSTDIAVRGYSGGKAVALLRSPASLRVWDLKQPAGTGAAVRLNSPAASPVRIVTARSTRSAPLVSRTGAQQVSVSSSIPVDTSLLTPLEGDQVIDVRAVSAGTQYWDSASGTWTSTKPTPSAASTSPPTAAPPTASPGPVAPSGPSPAEAPAPTSTPPVASTSTPTPTPTRTPTAAPTQPLAPSAADAASSGGSR